jgi:transposase-like protein
LVTEIIQRKTSVTEASRAFDLLPSEIEEWIDEDRRGLENALRAKPLDVKEQYERQIKVLREAYGEAMLGLRSRKNCSLCCARKRNDRDNPPGTQAGWIRRLDQQDLLMVRGAPAHHLLQASQGRS